MIDECQVVVDDLALGILPELLAQDPFPKARTTLALFRPPPFVASASFLLD